MPREKFSFPNFIRVAPDAPFTSFAPHLIAPDAPFAPPSPELRVVVPFTLILNVELPLDSHLTHLV